MLNAQTSKSYHKASVGASGYLCRRNIHSYSWQRSVFILCENGKGCFYRQERRKPAHTFKETIKIMIPLLISSLGITLAFKMKFWNIGAEGQIIMGGVFASYFALYHYDMPHYLLFIVMFVAAMIGGGLYGIIPAHFSRQNSTQTRLCSPLCSTILHFTL